MRRLLCLPLALALLGSPHGPAPAGKAARDKRPNIVILLADDLGYGDLGCYGHPTIRTPELDRMAAQGLRFTQFYAAAPVCTPSRAALLTGRLPVRSGMTRVLFPDSKGGLPASEVTLAAALRRLGYRTALIGKWHLGHLPPYRPLRHGFDRFYGVLYSNDMKPLALYRDDREIEKAVRQATLTERYTEEAVRLICEAGRAGPPQPFFLYLAYNAPHVPLHPGPGFAGRSRRGAYGDVVEELDASVGRVLKALREAGLDRETLVLFTSDNGPAVGPDYGLDGGSAGLLRGSKFSTWEGGVRVPCLARWPGRVKAGAVCADLASALDLFPTAVELAGGEGPRDRVLDGLSLAPVLLGTGPSPRRALAFYHDEELRAFRKGPWKVHIKTQSDRGDGPVKRHDPPLLFQVEHDPSERLDVARRHPEVVADLLREVARHNASVKAAPVQR